LNNVIATSFYTFFIFQTPLRVGCSGAFSRALRKRVRGQRVAQRRVICSVQKGQPI